MKSFTHTSLRSLLAAGALFVLAGQAYAGGHGGGHGGDDDAGEAATVEEIVEGVEVTLKLDLGTIEVIDVEPTRGQTSRMSFNLHLTFDPATEAKEIKALDSWHHRLREQAIIGVRATEIHDFLDPDLTRFRKQMLYRINRMLGKPIVKDVLFANFTFFSE